MVRGVCSERLMRDQENVNALKEVNHTIEASLVKEILKIYNRKSHLISKFDLMGFNIGKFIRSEGEHLSANVIVSIKWMVILQGK